MDLNSIIPAAATADTSTNWSDYQQNIFRAIIDTTDNLIVEAVAGSGKTTTVTEAVNRVKIADPAAEVLMVAFNKSIATELQRRVPYGVEAKTFHSLGLSTFHGKRPKVSGYKMRGILKDIMPTSYYEDHVRDLLRMISLVKANAILNPTAEIWRASLGDFDVNCPEAMESRFVKWADQAFLRSNRDKATIDFDDMLFLPIFYDWQFPQYDFVFVDEAQDLSPIQHEMVIRLLKPGGRVIAVGDTHQAIYGFRGADSDSMNRFRSQFNTTELPLSISYRCPRQVVVEAQRYVPHIRASDTADEGELQHYDRIEEPVTIFNKDDLIVCRNNAPLFRLGMQFIKARHPVTVRGNFGEQLISFIKGFKTKDIEVFLYRLECWFDTEYHRLLDAEMFSKAAMIRDKYEAVIAVSDGATSVDDVVQVLIRLFEPGPGAVLSSIHRAKGTEAKNVIFYLPSLLPSKYAKSKAQVQQEHNLSYVGITRSLSTLTYVEGE